MQDIFDLKGYIDKLATTINETCDNARNALNVLMGISVVMGGLILGVDDEILFLDQGATVPYAGIPITVSTVFAIFPVVYLVIYGLLCLKLLSIIKLTKEFITTQDILIDKTQSELLYPLTQQNDRLLKNAPNTYDNQLKSFFFLDSLLHKGHLAIIISFILLYGVPLAVLIKAMLVFLPYQSWIISISHWIVILALTCLCINLIRIIEKQNKKEKHHKALPLWGRVWVGGEAITIPHLTSPKGGGTVLLYKIIRFFSPVVPVVFCLMSAFALYDRMDDGVIDYGNYRDRDHKNYRNYCTYNVFPKTALDLSNKTLVKKPTPDAILAVAYEKDLQNKGNKKYFEKVKWQYTERYFLRNRSFKGIDLSYATAYKIDLEGSDLMWANLNGAYLTSANLSSVDMINADLSHADLSYADLSNANLTKAFLQGVDLTNANLLSLNFNEADLKFANLTGSDLSHADLSYADLMWANLSGADLRFANLTGAKSFEVKLINADLYYVELTNADLRGANLTGAMLILDTSKFVNRKTEADLYEENLEGIIYNSKMFHGVNKTDFAENIFDKSKMLDVCSVIIDNKEFNKKYKYLKKRKKVDNGYDYSAYCSD